MFTAACRFHVCVGQHAQRYAAHSRQQTRIISVAIIASHGEQGNARGKVFCRRWCSELRTNPQENKYKMDVKRALEILSTAKSSDLVNLQS